MCMLLSWLRTTASWHRFEEVWVKQGWLPVGTQEAGQYMCTAHKYVCTTHTPGSSGADAWAQRPHQGHGASHNRSGHACALHCLVGVS